MGLLEILGVTDWAAVGEYLKKNYIENADETRRRSHNLLLDQFYEGRGDDEMERIIGVMWKDKKNQDRRLEVNRTGVAKFNNHIARIATEKATVYSEPPRRSVGGSESNNALYQSFLDVVQQDDAMAELDRKLAYQEDALLWYRVRKTMIGEREPLLEVISPAAFWAVAHPRDRTLLVAIIFDQRGGDSRPDDPVYRVWTDDETFTMNAKCEVFKGSIEAWPIGMMPGVLCSTRKPGSKATLLAECPSADILSAQKMIRLQDLNLAKESISVNKQAYITGDTSATAMEQTADTDSEVFLGEGVTVTVVDRGVDPKVYRDAATYAQDSSASNHGLPPSVLHQQDATSGAEIELRRIPIREIRKRRIPAMRRIEARIVQIMAAVNGSREGLGEDGQPAVLAGDLGDFAFSAEGFSIDFGEIQQPMTRTEENANFEQERRLGLTDNYAEEMRRNPDIKTLAEAKRIVDERLARQTEYVASQKELMALNGSLGSAVGEPTPQENGAKGPPAKKNGGNDGGAAPAQPAA